MFEGKLFLLQFPNQFNTLHHNGILAVKLLGQHDAIEDDEADVDSAADHLLAVVWLLGYEDVRTQTGNGLVTMPYVVQQMLLASFYFLEAAI